MLVAARPLRAACQFFVVAYICSTFACSRLCNALCLRSPCTVHACDFCKAQPSKLCMQVCRMNGIVTVQSYVLLLTLWSLTAGNTDRLFAVDSTALCVDTSRSPAHGCAQLCVCCFLHLQQPNGQQSSNSFQLGVLLCRMWHLHSCLHTYVAARCGKQP